MVWCCSIWSLSGRGNFLPLIALFPLQGEGIKNFDRILYKVPSLAQGPPREWPMIGALKIKISLNELVNDRTQCPAIQGFVRSIPNSDRTLSIDRPLFAALKQYFFMLYFCVFILQRPLQFVFALFKYIFLHLIQLLQNLQEKNQVSTNLVQLKYDWSLLTYKLYLAFTALLQRK